MTESGSLPNWFDGLPIESALRYSPVAVVLIVDVDTPRTPPKMFLTFWVTFTLYWSGLSPWPARDRDRRIADKGAAAVGLNRPDAADAIAVVACDVACGRIGGVWVTRVGDRTGEGGGVGGPLLAVARRVPEGDVDRERGHAEQEHEHDRAPDEDDPAFVPPAHQLHEEVGTGSSWNTELEVERGRRVVREELGEHAGDEQLVVDLDSHDHLVERAGLAADRAADVALRDGPAVRGRQLVVRKAREVDLPDGVARVARVLEVHLLHEVAAGVAAIDVVLADADRRLTVQAGRAQVQRRRGPRSPR